MTSEGGSLRSQASAPAEHTSPRATLARRRRRKQRRASISGENEKSFRRRTSPPPTVHAPARNVVSRGGAEERGGAVNDSLGRAPCAGAPILSVHDVQVLMVRRRTLCARSAPPRAAAMVADRAHCSANPREPRSEMIQDRRPSRPRQRLHPTMIAMARVMHTCLRARQPRAMSSGCREAVTFVSGRDDLRG